MDTLEEIALFPPEIATLSRIRKKMPKVKMLIKLSGTRNGEDWPNLGETLDVPKQEAESLIANGFAEKVATPKKAPAKK